MGVRSVTTIKFKGPYSPSADDPGLDTGEGLTEQHHGPACDINNIIKNFTRGIPTEHVMAIQGVYGDFSDGEDFLEMQIKIKNAEDAFNSLDARIRQRFENDPAKLLDFVSNKENLDEAIKLGLVDSKPITPVSENSKPTIPVENKPA